MSFLLLRKKALQITAEEAILLKRKQKQEVVLEERRRLNEHRVKDLSARVIQSAWRKLVAFWVVTPIFCLGDFVTNLLRNINSRLINSDHYKFQLKILCRLLS